MLTPHASSRRFRGSSARLVESHVHGDHELFIGRTLVAETRGTLDGSGKLEPMPALLMGQRGRFGHFEEGFNA